MGIFINKGNHDFSEIVSSDYIDKSELISVINKTLCTEMRYSCISRCRRFGKSMAAKMLCAYYDKSCSSRELFHGLAIERDASFEQHLNKYNVLYLDVTNFTSNPDCRGHIVKSITDTIRSEVMAAFPNVRFPENGGLMNSLAAIYQQTGERFFFIIDEWDAICREYPVRRKYKDSPEDTEPTEMDDYVSLLRQLFKTQSSNEVFVGAYLTGILPIKKYKTESALNNFWEYSMVDPADLASFYGFTREEVRTLCVQRSLNFDDMQKWYDGYQIGDEPSMFNPASVMKATLRKRFGSYWAATGAYSNVASYISMNFEGLKDDIINMLAGGRCPVNTTKFQNDMSIVGSKDDVLTALIHLGYLAYDMEKKQCYVPNKEVRDELLNAVEDSDWTELNKVIASSEALLAATLRGDADKVAKAIDLAHDENTSILSYNDENSLACVLSIAYIYAKNDYIIHRELATGKGFADLVFIPRKNVDSPALVVELKYNKDADTAIEQIHRRQYPSKIRDYTDNLLLVGINYDKQRKKHSCRIEKL